MTITLLDGGMGQELLKRSSDSPTPLWATQLMIDHPEIVKQVHNDYFSAGADICTTNTYAIHRDRLLRAGKIAEGLYLSIRLEIEFRSSPDLSFVPS